jgi:dihydrofolate reductase
MKLNGLVSQSEGCAAAGEAAERAGGAMRIVVINHVTLDGVMQGPGRPDEDPRDGFTHGGWAASRSNTELQQAWGERLTRSSGFLLGRRTYDDVLGYWNTQDSPFKAALNQAAKYVASTGTPTLKWPNSTLLTGGIPAAVTSLRAAPGNDLHIMGSGALIRSLSEHGLIDEYVLAIHPIVLGHGHRLFADGFPPATFDLTRTVTTATGVIVAAFRARPPAA